MRKVTLDIEVSPSQDGPGVLIVQAVMLLRSGDRAAADRAYRNALAGNSEQASTWSNLAAFALMTGDVGAASRHVRHALDHAPDHVDALVNLSIVALGQGVPEEALSIVRRAVELQPNHGKALSNLGTLLNARNEFSLAEEVLRRAVIECPYSGRVAYELALVLRSLGKVDATRQRALVALSLIARALPPSLVALPPQPLVRVTDARAALFQVHDFLVASAQPFYLMAGTLLALVRDGDLMAHDKDIDLALPFDCDREQIAGLFERHPAFSVPPRPVAPPTEPLWAFGVIHKETNITIDLFFAKHEDDGVHFGFGVPPTIIRGCVRPFVLGELQWQGRSWPIPAPPEQYLEDVYGPDWRTPDPYFDTVLSNPCRTPESLPLAFNLGLLRLGDSLQKRDWLRAYSLCQQLLAREHVAEVVAVSELLQQRCAALRQ